MKTGQGVADLRDTEEADLRYPLAAPWSRRSRRLAAVVWPGFLVGGVLELLVFAFVDPQQLHWLGGAPLALGRTAVYTLAFFVFWLLASLGCGVTVLLLTEPDDAGGAQGPQRLS